MKRNFLKVVATAATALFVGATVAQAASVEWSGSLRPRFEVNERHDFNADTSADYFVSTQVRLNAKAEILPDTSAFIQLQSVRTWGSNQSGAASSNTNPAGSGNASFGTPDDRDASVGVHQAYFTLKNFATLPVDLQLGRQEVILDGHRLFGNTVWTQGQQSHDAVRVNHAHDNMTFSALYIRGNDGGNAVTADPHDIDVYVAYANIKGILGGGLSLIYSVTDDECGGGACTAGPSDNNIHTIGARQAGQLFGLDYRAEYYYQFGGAEADAAGVAGGYTTTGAGSGVDRSAYLLGVRVGKKFNNVMWKPGITLWYDYKSGTSDEDARNGDFKSFNTLFDTGHKFYGLMDLFLASNGSDTNHLGLVDYAVKTSISPAKNWTLKSDWHYFTTAESANANILVSGRAVANVYSDSKALGHEIDLTLVHKYNANTNISFGYSRFMKDPLLALTANGLGTAGNGPSNSANWAYLQFDVRF
ncbi:MAG: alginate export family protein [Nitrospinae bacterium]|nr:alginate export family protein [Nitrospinota bacterium]